jgi:hypothetical protein
MNNGNSLVLSNATDEAYGLIHEGCGGSVLSICVARSTERVRMTARLNTRRLLLSRKPAQVVEKSLPDADWIRLTQLVNNADFWALPEWSAAGGLDGWDWTIEGRRAGIYHASTAWCGLGLVGFRELGDFLVAVSGMRVPQDIP